MRKFIVIKCNILGDQWECDANRKLLEQVYTEEEVKNITKIVGYEIAASGYCNGVRMSYYSTDNLDDAKKWFNNNYDNICKFEGCQVTFEKFMLPVYEGNYEVYEILSDGKIVLNEKYTTYWN